MMVEVLENYRSLFLLDKNLKEKCFFFDMVTAGINTLDLINVIMSQNEVFQSIYISFSVQITVEIHEKKKKCFCYS